MIRCDGHLINESGEAYARQYLPNVDIALSEGSFYFSASTRVTVERRHVKRSDASSHRVSKVSSKCLGSSSAPKQRCLLPGATTPKSSENTTQVKDAGDAHQPPSKATKESSSTSSSGPNHRPKSSSSGFLPRRVRKRLMQIEFKFPDIQLPSIPLPSLPTLTLPSWIASDEQQLAESEARLMVGCYYRRRLVAGMNTLIAQHHDRVSGGVGEETSSQAVEVATEFDADGDAPSSFFEKGDGMASKAEGSSSSSSITDQSCVLHQGGAVQSCPSCTSSSIGLSTSTPREIVVLVHGFGGGSAMWAQNWEALRDDGAVDVCAFDLPGFGRSERDLAAGRFSRPEDSIAFYCKKFAEWFADMDFKQPVVLCGHSFGAYLSCFFVTEYFAKMAEAEAPQSLPLFGKRCEDVVKHVVLADPWGVELIPREFMKKEMRHLSARDRLIAKLFYHFTPLGGLRAAGPIGPRLVPAIRPDLADGWVGEQRERFFQYIYHCNAQEPPSGELAFRSCVAYAGHPRIAAGPMLLEHLPDDLAVTFLYGQTTMMDSHAGYKLMEKLWKRGHRQCRWAEISGAGHQIFSENPKEFNFEMKKVISQERQRNVNMSPTFCPEIPMEQREAGDV